MTFIQCHINVDATSRNAHWVVGSNMRYKCIFVLTTQQFSRKNVASDDFGSIMA